MSRGMQVPLAAGQGQPGTSRKQLIPGDTSISAPRDPSGTCDAQWKAAAVRVSPVRWFVAAAVGG